MVFAFYFSLVFFSSARKRRRTKFHLWSRCTDDGGDEYDCLHWVYKRIVRQNNKEIKCNENAKWWRSNASLCRGWVIVYPVANCIHIHRRHKCWRMSSIAITFCPRCFSRPFLCISYFRFHFLVAVSSFRFVLLFKPKTNTKMWWCRAMM